MTEGERGGGERDPFEDLDQFFAPIEEAGDPEDLPAATGEDEEPAAAPPAADVSDEDAAEALDDLELTIDLPDEDDLVEGSPEADRAAEAEEVAGEAADDVTASLPAEELAEEGEWDRLRAEALAGQGIETPAVEESGELEAAGELEGYPDLADDVDGVEVDLGEDQVLPEPADVGAATEAEAAAEHFASGMRGSAEDLERELLADLDEGAASETVRIEPPAPAVEAPTWQEGAQPVLTEEPPADTPAAARNVPAALVSGILLGAAVLALLAIDKGPFVVLATAAVLLAQAELYAVMRMRGLQPATLLGLVCGGFTFVGAYLHGETAVLLGPALAMGLTVLWYVAAPPQARKHTTANAAATALGLLYVPFMASFAMLLLRAPEIDEVSSGKNLFLAMLVLTVLYDVSAYAVGSIYGNRPLAPTVSPNKSWEGAIAATFLVIIVGLSIVPNFTPFDREGGAGMAVGLALLIAIVAPLGDLVESALKRDLGVKDMGSLLPGHGGMLDRIDAVLFAAPAGYFLMRIVLT